jgi:hypothetical protein
MRGEAWQQPRQRPLRAISSVNTLQFPYARLDLGNLVLDITHLYPSELPALEILSGNDPDFARHVYMTVKARRAAPIWRASKRPRPTAKAPAKVTTKSRFIDCGRSFVCSPTILKPNLTPTNYAVPPSRNDVTRSAPTTHGTIQFGNPTAETSINRPDTNRTVLHRTPTAP